MQIVVILEVMWGWCGLERDRTRFFRINPDNHSGKRLHRMIGHSNFWVTNACPETVSAASAKGTPDPAWLRENLKTLAPDLVLVCGLVAQDTFKADMVSPSARVIQMQHPASRRWTKAMIAATTELIQEAQR